VSKAKETDVKFEITEGAELLPLDGMGPEVTATAGPTMQNNTTYFDTADLRLLKRGVTVRRRHSEVALASGTPTSPSSAGAPLRSEGEPGEQWILKVPLAAGKATHAGTEMSWPGDQQAPPTVITNLTRGLALGAPLVAVAETVTVRRTVELSDKDRSGRRRAVVNDDQVRITPATHAGVETAFRQVQVVVDADDRDLLDRIAAHLERAGAVRGEDEPRLARAFLPVVPTNPQPVRHGRDPQVAVVVSAISASLDQLLDQDIGLRLDDHPEFVHQARVACRRLRSDLGTFSDVLDPAWVERTRSGLRWLGSLLGVVRDADVLAGRLAAHAEWADPTDEAAFGDLAAILATERAVAGAGLRQALDSDRYVSLLAALDAAVTSPPLAAAATTESAGGSAADSTDRVRARWRKLRRAVANLDQPPSDTDLHAIRIQAKKARYAAEATIPVAGDHVRRFAGEVAEVQSVLGDQHDSASAEAWLRDRAGHASPAAAFAAGQCVARERDRQATERRRWVETWEALERSNPRL
jgi:CHAD domain-containing protein